jgi:hypothetical protein
MVMSAPFSPEADRSSLRLDQAGSKGTRQRGERSQQNQLPCVRPVVMLRS